MPVIAGRTRGQLGTSVGYLLGSPFILLEADGVGTASTFVTDDTPQGGENEHRGKWLKFTSGANNSGLIRRVTASSINATTLQTTFNFVSPVNDATADGDTAELWNEEHPPTALHDFINQALIDATGHVYDPIENITLHSGARNRWDIPTGISMIRKVQYRASMSSETVIPVQVWDESIDADFTVTQDIEDLLYGLNATRFVIAGTVSVGDLASMDIGSLDLSRYTHIEFPIKVQTAVASDDLRIILSATANGASETEAIVIPAISARTDTWVRVALANPEADTAIISVALEYNANNAANTVWVGEIVATDNDSYVWADVARHLWSIDKESRDLVLTTTLDYWLLKIVGGDAPALLTSDSATTEIDDTYIIRYATAMALLSEGGGSTTDQEDRRDRGKEWLALAEQAKNAFPLLVDVRTVT